MGRILAAGSKERIDEVLDILAKLNAIHFIEYDGTDDGFNLGTPKEESEVVGKRLNKFCLLYTSPSPRDGLLSRMPSSA